MLEITGSKGGHPGQNRDKFGGRDRGKTPGGKLPPGPQNCVVPFLTARRRKSASQQKGGRKPSAAKRRRQQQLAEVNAEIDQLVAQFHGLLPRSEATEIGGIYARYSTEFQDSIIDQVRALLEFALRNRIFVPRELIFLDLAEKGGRERRPGLTALRAALAERKLKVLLVFSTNRLFRKAYKSLKFVEEEIVERGLRCVFVKSGVDTGEKDRWRLHLQMLSAMDEAYTGIYAENIHAAQLGLASGKFVHGTLAIGYRGEPIPGQFTKRNRPRCLVVIDEPVAEYVRQIFKWFAEHLLPIDEVCRRLNDDSGAPTPPKSENNRWSHQAVLRVLQNERYIGIWHYGKNESRWISSADYSRQYPREKPLGTFFREELRIIENPLWHKAQIRIATFNKRRGRKPGSGQQKPVFKLLNGILFCPTHESALRIGGANAGTFLCKHCRETSVDNRPLFTLLNQPLAERCTMSVIRGLLLGDPALVEMIVAACQQAAEELQQPDMARLGQLRSRNQQLTRSIEVALRDPGDSAEDQAETTRLVRQLRLERSELGAQISLFEAAQNRPARIPTWDEVQQELNRLDQILLTASTGQDVDARGMARGIVELVTGGCIELTQCGERAKHKGWLQGTFQCDLVNVVASQLTGVDLKTPGSATKVVIDFREPTSLDKLAQQARELFDQGVLNVEIARQLKCSKSRVTRLLKHAFDSAGEVKPDGRTRRSQLVIKHSEMPLYQQLSDQVMELAEQNLLLQDIATQLGCDRNTVTQAVKYWHTSRGLPVPDGRTRRKSLPRCQRDSPSTDGESGPS